MKRVAMFIAGIAIAVSAMAEASFEQIEGLIQQRNYAAAAAGLEVVIQNHPKSAKAFYAMAQAQAGLGNLEKAQKALNIATGLNPTLDFAPASSVQSLKDAITPQVSKIEYIEETHYMRNFAYFALFAGFGVLCYFMWTIYARRIEEESAAIAEAAAARNAEWEAKRKQEYTEMLAKQDAERKAELAAEAALKAHKNYGHERFDPANPDKLKSVKQFKAEQDARALRDAQIRAETAEAQARMYRTSAQAVQPAPTTVVQNSSNDMLTGVLIGNMISNMGHSHDTERTVVRETVREVPAPSRDSSWDDTPSRSSSSRSSSWDDDSSSSSSSRSSSWESSSSSSSSSSWDSGSSSSDSSSSSSWD